MSALNKVRNGLSALKCVLVLFILFNNPEGIWGQKSQTLEQVFINPYVSTHFVMNDPIKYVDISTSFVVGDIPLKNVLRVKPLSDTVYHQGIVTIATEREMVQFELVYTPDMQKAVKQYIVKEAPVYRHPEVKLSEKEMKRLSDIVLNKKSHNRKSTESHKIKMTLNNVYVLYDHFFFDITVENKSNIAFDIDQVRFKIEDEKKTKATNFQQIEVTPKYQTNKATSFTKAYRNVFVFEKFTFPDDKVFTIELAESPISGRAEVLRVKYKEVLNADTF